MGDLKKGTSRTMKIIGGGGGGGGSTSLPCPPQFQRICKGLILFISIMTQEGGGLF